MDDVTKESGLSPEERALRLVREQILAEDRDSQRDIQGAYDRLVHVVKGSEGGILALALLCAEIDCGVA